MKLFVAVVMLVVVSLMVVAYVVWEIGAPPVLVPWGSPPESGDAPKGRMTNNDEKQTQTQQPQQNARNIPVLSPEPETNRAQAATQHSGGKINPDEEPMGGMKMVLSIITVAIALGALLFTALNHRRNKKADKFAREKDRPLLDIVDWNLTPHEAKKPWTLEDKPDVVKYNFVNTNGTVAILEGVYEDRWIVDKLPSASNLRERLDGKLRGKPITKGDKFPRSLEQIPTADWKAFMYGPKTLYAFVYADYSDTSGGQYKIGVLARYVPDDKKFVVEQREGYTCNT